MSTVLPECVHCRGPVADAAPFRSGYVQRYWAHVAECAEDAWLRLLARALAACTDEQLEQLDRAERDTRYLDMALRFERSTFVAAEQAVQWRELPNGVVELAKRRAGYHG